MKVSEMRGISVEEAKAKIGELRTELSKERAVVAGGTRPENPGNIRTIRKNIARLLTVINEKEKGIAVKTKEKTPAKKEEKEKPKEHDAKKAPTEKKEGKK